jgi:hypothetical protein
VAREQDSGSSRVQRTCPIERLPNGALVRVNPLRIRYTLPLSHDQLQLSEGRADVLARRFGSSLRATPDSPAPLPPPRHFPRSPGMRGHPGAQSRWPVTSSVQTSPGQLQGFVGPQRALHFCMHDPSIQAVLPWAVHDNSPSRQ